MKEKNNTRGGGVEGEEDPDSRSGFLYKVKMSIVMVITIGMIKIVMIGMILHNYGIVILKIVMVMMAQAGIMIL